MSYKSSFEKLELSALLVFGSKECGFYFNKNRTPKNFLHLYEWTCDNACYVVISNFEICITFF